MRVRDDRAALVNRRCSCDRLAAIVVIGLLQPIVASHAQEEAAQWTAEGAHYTLSLVETYAIGECAEKAPNTEFFYDPLNGTTLLEGRGAADMRACLVDEHGWEVLGPPEYRAGTMRSPRWHDLPLPATMGDYERGMVARDREEFDTALTLLGALAEQGEADAQYLLADMYYEGDGVSLDFVEAARWLRAAAEQGHVLAQDSLAHLYQDGEGVPQDLEQAFRWFLEAARQGNLDSQMSVALAYWGGEGVEQDFVQAYEWMYMLRRAYPRGSMGEMMVSMALDELEDELSRNEIRSARRAARQRLEEQEE